MSADQKQRSTIYVGPTSEYTNKEYTTKEYTPKEYAPKEYTPNGTIITPSTILGSEKNHILSAINTNNNNMNDVLTNNIGEFYRDAKIFITGGTGFVGKALLEKLLRSCDLIDSIYLLMRPKRGLQVEQRLKELWKNPVFNKIKEKNPEYFDKIKIVPGDVSMPNLGLSDMDREKLCDQINIVFHSAATVRFDEGLKEAVVLNTQGTQRMLELCNDMKKLQSFVHVSTAYSNADKREVEEWVYKPPHDPKAIINCVEALPGDVVELLWPKLQGNHPNTYTLTKAMAEHLVWEYSAKLPAAIIRPSIVTGAWKEPFPGWVDNISGITGIMMEIGRGTIKSIVCDDKLTIDVIPVDIVANTLVTAAWHTAAYRSNTMRVYNCTSGQVNAIKWKEYGEHTQHAALQYPSKYVTWYPGFTFRTNRMMHWVCSLFYHTIPACIFDILLYCTKKKPIMLRISKKFERAAKAGTFFAINEWNFHAQTVKSLVEAVKYAEDGENFNVDLRKETGFAWDSYISNFMLGIRQYVLKDDLSSLPMAKTKMNRFYWVNKAFQLLMMYILLRMALL